MSHLFDAWLEDMRRASGRTTAGEEVTAPEASAAAQPNAENPEAVETSPAEAPAAETPASETPAAEKPAAEKPARASRRPAKVVDDALLLAAVDTAREAIAEVAEAAHIGAHLSAVMEGQRLATHAFACTMPGYRGWHWVAVLARAPRAKKITVCETALLPGEDALVAPQWVPWSERLQPGDMGAKDVLPKVEDDPNLEPGFEQVATDPDDEEAIDQIPNFEWGLGRRRVLSREGLANAASRWEHSEAGPEGEYARRASAHCSTCGYLMPMAGALRTQFGVCANAWSPFDGRVVALNAGCGAHSETDEKPSTPETPEPVVDDLHEDFEMLTGPEAAAGSQQPADPQQGAETATASGAGQDSGTDTSGAGRGNPATASGAAQDDPTDASGAGQNSGTDASGAAYAQEAPATR